MNNIKGAPVVLADSKKGEDPAVYILRTANKVVEEDHTNILPSEDVDEPGDLRRKLHQLAVGHSNYPLALKATTSPSTIFVRFERRRKRKNVFGTIKEAFAVLRIHHVNWITQHDDNTGLRTEALYLFRCAR